MLSPDEAKAIYYDTFAKGRWARVNEPLVQEALERASWQAVIDAVRADAPRYLCPVCDEPMQIAPRNHALCSHCLTHFGYDDYNANYELLRERWRGKNAPAPKVDADLADTWEEQHHAKADDTD